MATFTYTPDFNASKQKQPIVSKVQFGDGYVNRISKGINSQPETWSLTFANRSAEEGDAIDAFLATQGGTEAFDWTTPNGDAKKFICSTWNVAIVNGSYRTVTATFDEVFDP